MEHVVVSEFGYIQKYTIGTFKIIMLQCNVRSKYLVSQLAKIGAKFGTKIGAEFGTEIDANFGTEIGIELGAEFDAEIVTKIDVFLTYNLQKCITFNCSKRNRSVMKLS